MEVKFSKIFFFLQEAAKKKNHRSHVQNWKKKILLNIYIEKRLKFSHFEGNYLKYTFDILEFQSTCFSRVPPIGFPDISSCYQFI